jgi:uncharacterized repeat protein (TIGR01451 family)
MKRRWFFTALLLIILTAGLLAPAAGAQQPAGIPQTTTVDAGTGIPPEKSKPEEPQGASLPVRAGIEGVATDYGFSQTTGTYTEIAGGTVVTTSCDDTSFGTYAIPFTFTYNGTAYTTFGIQCNGFIAMGATPSSSYVPISGGSTNNIIAGMAADQQTGTVNSEIRYETLGTSPNQVLVIQWKNFRHYSGAQVYNFQIRLYESSNVVEVVYGSFTETSSYTQQVGLRGASSADFNNRKSSTGWSNTVAGTLNTDAVTLSTAYVPTSGLTFDWTPIPPHPIFDTSYKTAPAQVVIGNPIAYTVHIKNSGTAAANAATMVDPIPAGTTYNNDVTCSSGTCGFDGTNVTWSGSVAVGGDETVSFSVGTAGLPCGTVVVNQAAMGDPGLFGGPVVRSASTSLVGTTPTALDGFEVSVPPPGWTETIVNDPGTDPDWTRESVGTYPTINPHGGTYMAKFNSFSAPNLASSRLWTPALDLSGYAAPQVVFWMSHDTGYSANADRIQMQVSTDGVTWADFGAPVLRYDASCTTACWKEHTIVLPAGYNINGVYIGFLGISAYGNNFYLDDTALSEGWYPCPYISLAPDAAKSGCPGSSVDYALTLTNMTPDGDTFDLIVAGNAWTTTPNPVQLALGAGASGQVAVTVDIPWAGGNDTAVVTALGQAYGGTDTATLATTGSSTYWEQIATEPNNGRMDNVTGTAYGKIFSVTGYGADANVRSYDPATNAWTVVGTPPPFGVNYARSGCSFADVVVMYGDVSTANFTGLWLYDMGGGVWQQLAPSGTPPPYTGIWAPAWAYDDESGLCYLTGGATVVGAGDLTTVYVYDTNANAWLAPLPNFTSVRDFHAAYVYTRPADGHRLLCVAGGNNGAGMTSTQCYDFVAQAWDAENADMGALPQDVWGMGYAQKVHEGVPQMWMVDGVRAGLLSNASSFFDVFAGTWNDGGALPTSPIYRTSAVTLDNEIYRVGGSTGSFSYTGLADHHVQCPACEPPSDVDFTWDPPSPLVGEEVTFTATAYGTEPLAYAWDFGDGGGGGGAVATHTYAVPGTYLVTLTVTNPCGSTQVQHEVVVVSGCDPVHDAAFTFSPDFPIPGQVVDFLATAQGSEPISYAWDFGDGTVGSGPEFYHAYTYVGTYLVTLTASNACGQQVVTHEVVVQPPQYLHMHLWRMKMNSRAYRPPYYKVVVLGIIHDQNHSVLGEVTVAGHWTYPDGTTETVTVVTDLNGRWKVRVKKAACGLYQFDIDGLSKPGYIDDPAHDHMVRHIEKVVPCK